MQTKTLKQVQVKKKAEITKEGVSLQIFIPIRSLGQATLTLNEIHNILGQEVEITLFPTQGDMFAEDKRVDATKPLKQLKANGLDCKKINKTFTDVVLLKSGKVRGAFLFEKKLYFVTTAFEVVKPKFQAYELIPAQNWKGDMPTTIKEKDKNEKVAKRYPYPFTGVSVTYKRASYVVGDMVDFNVPKQTDSSIN